LVDANQALAKFGVSREQLRIGKIALERAIQAEDREKQRKARGSGSRSRVISFRIQRAMLEMDLVAKEEALAKAYFNVQKSLGLGWVSAQQTDADR
jgi:outer membrane protein TolC